MVMGDGAPIGRCLVLVSILLGSCVGGVAPPPAGPGAGGSANVRITTSSGSAPRTTGSGRAPGEGTPHDTRIPAGDGSANEGRANLTVADATKAVNEGSLGLHVGNRIVNYDVPTCLVQTRCGKDASDTVALWQRIISTQGLEPNCIRGRRGWIAC